MSKAFNLICLALLFLSIPCSAQSKNDVLDFNRLECEQAFERFCKPEKYKDLCKILKDSQEYRSYIRKRLSEEDMPPFLEFLPVIESNYNPVAKPVNGVSVGMWQFMPNSTKGYLELNEWIDQRKDPWLSTDAALKKLKDNYRQFNNWELALAAYNCGAGAVKRALEKTADKTYWALCSQKLIPQHAVNYVPNFMAVCRLVYQGALYGYEDAQKAAEIDEYYSYILYDYITVKDSIGLDLLAMELRLDCETLKALNLSLVKNKTPPDTRYTLRLPQGMYLSARDAIAVINKNALICR